MKRKARAANTERKFTVIYDLQQHGWIVTGAPGPRTHVFTTRLDAENYCIHSLGQAPASTTPAAEQHQELPMSSVWTGAPWDRSFKDV